MGHLSQKDAVEQLKNRSTHLEAELVRLDAALPS